MRIVIHNRNTGEAVEDEAGEARRVAVLRPARIPVKPNGSSRSRNRNRNISTTSSRWKNGK